MAVPASHPVRERRILALWRRKFTGSVPIGHVFGWSGKIGALNWFSLAERREAKSDTPPVQYQNQPKQQKDKENDDEAEVL